MGAKPTEASCPADAGGRTATVLIVEDDREIARAVGLRLGGAGFRPLVAFDGGTGLAMALRDPPDATVLDLRLPAMDGFAVLAGLLQSEATAGVPAVVLSADAAERAKLRAQRQGAAFFVEKPYRASDLISAVAAAIAGRRAAAMQIGEGSMT
jgi:two-component system KDP operon response regulator KdpE